MWKNFGFVDMIPFLQKIYFFTFSKVNVNESFNYLFWCVIVLSVTYYYFNKFLKVFLKSNKISYYKWKSTIRLIWNICFYGSSVVFLYLCRTYMMMDDNPLNVNHIFPQHTRINPMFLQSNNCALFNGVTLLFLTFYGTSTILDLYDKNIIEAVTKIVYSCCCMCLNSYGYKNFAEILNLNLGLFNLLNDCIILTAWHTRSTRRIFLILLAWLNLFYWSYMFLNLIPFQYLLPTIEELNINFGLNFILWIWYGLSVWNSPHFQLICHHFYHDNNSMDCIDENSWSRCMLLRDSQELRHIKKLTKSVLELKLANQKSNVTLGRNENSSAKAFQTLKCMITLKRKLKRIRERKESLSLSVKESVD